MVGVNDGDDLVLFERVRIIRSTSTDLFCRILGRNVWLPRRHVSGDLHGRGDRGELSVRRWVAYDRRLIDLSGNAAPRPAGTRSLAGPSALHLVGGA